MLGSHEPFVSSPLKDLQSCLGTIGVRAGPAVAEEYHVFEIHKGWDMLIKVPT